MNEDVFNLELRKFLKTVGVTSQREIEAAVRQAAAAGTLPASPLRARVVLTIDGIALSHKLEGTIALG